ncbi:MAG: SGNH/GDSL hydrolase family protein [Chloroflexi bacterium CFX4]|nr:SGNH/GDSL hydrolase family protein [Chloroflexi bacterium CFX4]MDL1921599.1 hypothetical protein [Chloroflexi bacterium CFX3]
MLNYRILRHAGWLIAILVSLVLLFEVGVRVFWTALPHDLRMAIVGVRVLPWSEETLDLPQAKFKVEAAESQVESLDALILGDSFTFCWMASDDCWVEHLNTHGWRALSAAVIGSGSTGQLEVLHRLLPNVQPRLIIWQWHHGDANDNCQLARGSALAKAAAEAAPERPSAVGSGLGQYSAFGRMIGSWLRWRAFAPPNTLATDAALPCEGDMASVLNDYDAGIALAAEHNATVIIALVPYIDEVEGAQDADSPVEEARQLRRTLLAHCAARGYHCVDPLAAMRAADQRGQPAYDRADFHLNAYGNRLFAEALIAYIERHKLLPAP